MDKSVSKIPAQTFSKDNLTTAREVGQRKGPGGSRYWGDREEVKEVEERTHQIQVEKGHHGGERFILLNIKSRGCCHF